MSRVSIMRILTGFVAIVMLVNLVVAVDHTVGSPNGGWDLSTDLQTWASSQTFSVGDNLVFRFDSSHDVLEVSPENYNSCSISSPISTSVASPTRIPLAASGSRYFVCGRANHCSQGMKVQINTVAAAPGPPQTGTPSTPTPPANGPTTSSPPPPTTGETVNPPSSAITLKMATGSVLAFGFFVMILLSL